MSFTVGEEQIASGSDPTAIGLAQDAAPVIQGHLDHLLQMSDDTPDAVPSGLALDGAPTLLGASMTGLGLMVVAASLVFFVRRGRVRA